MTDRPPPLDEASTSAGVLRGASIGDVARLAGVSPTTVSRVSTGVGIVRESTRRRVLDAMRTLGYTPNHAARALRYGSFGTIGVIAHQLGRTGESRTVESVVAAARREGYGVTLVDVESPTSDEVDAAVQRLTHRSIDGLVIIRAETATPATLQLPARLPVAVSDSRFVGHHPAVGPDQTAGTRDAVEHLLALGHRTVHHVAGPAGSGPAGLRAAGWRATLAAAGRSAPEPLPGDWSAASGYAAGLALPPDATAVFCANDETAAGLVAALDARGLRVPQDVSVVGFDDIPLAGFLRPALTTVRQDFARVGEELVHLLVRQVAGEELADHRVVVPAPLVVRASTAPPPAG